MLTVTPPALSITTATLPNGLLGAPYDQTLEASGGISPFVWALNSGALPHNLLLSASSSNSVTIAGTPDTVGQGLQFTIQVTDAVQQIASQTYTLSILPQPDSLSLSPGSLDFGAELVGSTSNTVTETLTNTGNSALVITSVTISPSASGTNEFGQTSTTCGATLAAGSNCGVRVTFAPSQLGPRSAALTISDDTAGSPQSVSLSGVGLTKGPNASLSTTRLVFLTQLVGTTSPAQAIRLSNYGTMTLNVASITASSFTASAEFAETDNCMPSVASGATCTIRATFRPGASGSSFTGQISIVDDAAGSPQTVSLSGSGTTRTSPLTGSCFVTCAQPFQSSLCPAGQPAEMPGFSTHYPCGPDDRVPVDLARRCGGHPPLPDGGYCARQ